MYKFRTFHFPYADSRMIIADLKKEKMQIIRLSNIHSIYEVITQDEVALERLLWVYNVIEYKSPYLSLENI